MIKIRLSDLLGKHKMTQKALSEITGIRPATISKMYYEEVKRIDVRHLNNICKAFDCEISELLEYIPDKKVVKKYNFLKEPNLFFNKLGLLFD